MEQKEKNSIIKKLIDTHTTISTMESCTSGMIASTITDTEGASAIFPGGYVTYLNETKIFIGVEEEIIQKYGVYSKECAEAMAKTVQEKLHTDIAVGITGTTGNIDPNNSDSVQGVVYFCIRKKDLFRGYSEIPFLLLVFRPLYLLLMLTCNSLISFHILICIS